MKRYAKLILVLLLAITAFHLSGAEAAFCDDGSGSQPVESHGCMSCQPGHHTVALPQSMVSYMEFPTVFFSPEDVVIRLTEPAHFILRPPISF